MGRVYGSLADAWLGESIEHFKRGKNDWSYAELTDLNTALVSAFKQAVPSAIGHNHCGLSEGFFYDPAVPDTISKLFGKQNSYVESILAGYQRVSETLTDPNKDSIEIFPPVTAEPEFDPEPLRVMRPLKASAYRPPPHPHVLESV